MATSYLNDLNFDAALPSSVSFTNSGWAFNSNTKLWFGGGPSAAKRYKITASQVTVWDGYLPVLMIGTTPYPGEILLGHTRNKLIILRWIIDLLAALIAYYKLQGIGDYALTDESTSGPAYLGSSTAGTPNLANAPSWVADVINIWNFYIKINTIEPNIAVYSNKSIHNSSGFHSGSTKCIG